MRIIAGIIFLIGSYASLFGQTDASTKSQQPTIKSNTTTQKVFPHGGKTITLVIDPGHGGRDPGKPRGSIDMLHEKDLNLKIALLLGSYIEERTGGVKIVYTRKTDKTVGLDEIVNIANNSKADYFISIHSDSNPNSAIYGTRTHIHSHKFKASRKLALMIEHEFATRAGRHSRGIQDARDRGYNLQVLQYTNMPGVLVECGFLTNPEEEKFLNSTTGQELIASAIFRAFRDFVQEEHGLEDRSTVYRVQIMATTQPVTQDYPKFKELGMRVEELEYPNENFKYRYVVGREYEKAQANRLADKVKKMGFKDAFVVSMKN
jgi:N-acetylmuramoyl-L-alanine amidase